MWPHHSTHSVMEVPAALAHHVRMSPTILVAGGFNFFFYSRDASGEGLEREHVHVRKGSGEAKLWISSGELVYSYGFSPRELRKIRKIVVEQSALLKAAWNEHFREPPRDVR